MGVLQRSRERRWIGREDDEPRVPRGLGKNRRVAEDAEPKRRGNPDLARQIPGVLR